MIEFKNVKKTYPNGTEALNGIDLKIDDGEFVFIVGASGAGKSTLTKLLTREEKITEGQLTVNEFDLVKMPERKVPYYRRQIGVVFQDFRLLPDMTVFENVAFAMQIIGESKKTIKRRVPTILNIVGLQDKANSFPSQLSGGEQQRVAIARALAKNPGLLLCDEPTGALDYQTGKAILKLLQDTSREKGMTVVIITHNSALTAMADRVVRIKNGTVIGTETNGNPTPVEDIEW